MEHMSLHGYIERAHFQIHTGFRRLTPRAKRNSTRCSVSHQEQSCSNRVPTFWERLLLAWQVLFPPSNSSAETSANIAKQRLKMVLIADRCAVSDAAKRMIVSNVVGAMSHFVEVESEEKVQLNVTTDSELGTIYSITIPVRRVKPEYQLSSKDLEGVELAEGLTCNIVLDPSREP
ncbi:hypothetical protein SELMODRAFT_415331 [Selaginella moellendorffii]|uniref:Plastid division regulator MinE n=1 Tax=Selaginella moellendorffii TaxID=88036 RepID=D8RVS7_SELML|nr:hypothetical protein SELMODRAFT_415331 [Selaginella moellendorffii]